MNWSLKGTVSETFIHFCMSICPPLHSSVHLYVCLLICLPISSFVCLSVHLLPNICLSSHLNVCLSVHMSVICLSVCSYVCDMFVCLSTHLYVCLSVHMAMICLSAYLCIYPSVHTSVQGILKGKVSLYHWPPVWLVWISLFCKEKQKLSVVIQLIPNQSNRRSSVQWYFPL